MGEQRTKQAGEFRKSETKYRMTILENLTILEQVPGLPWGRGRPGRRVGLAFVRAWGGVWRGVWRVLGQTAPLWDAHGPEMLLFAFFSGIKRERDSCIQTPSKHCG